MKLPKHLQSKCDEAAKENVKKAYNEKPEDNYNAICDFKNGSEWMFDHLSENGFLVEVHYDEFPAIEKAQLESKLSAALELINKMEEALKMYGQKSGKTYWLLCEDKYGVTCQFDWDGELQNEAWEIAEKALSSIAIFRKSGDVK